MRNHTNLSWLAVALLLAMGGVLAGCPTEPEEEDPHAIVPGLGECDSDDGTYTEVDGVWHYTMDGVDTGQWRFGVLWADHADGTGVLSWYGCVIDGAEQTYEWSGLQLLDQPTTAPQTLTPGSVAFDVGVFQAGLNSNLDGDNDVFQIFIGSSGTGTVDEFDADTGVMVGSIEATADLAAQNEADDQPAEIVIDFDLTWTP
jgi:hypothetical protein